MYVCITCTSSETLADNLVEFSQRSNQSYVCTYMNHISCVCGRCVEVHVCITCTSSETLADTLVEFSQRSNQSF